MTREQQRTLMVAVLSLSLLTVMAGTAVAPALDVIREHFSDEPVALVQMVISMPALFIALTSPLFGRLAAKMTAKRLAVGALVLYVAAGAGAGLVDNLWAVLAFRALLGVSVGNLFPGGDAKQAHGVFVRHESDGRCGGNSRCRLIGSHELAHRLPGVPHGTSLCGPLRGLHFGRDDWWGMPASPIWVGYGALSWVLLSSDSPMGRGCPSLCRAPPSNGALRRRPPSCRCSPWHSTLPSS